MMWDYETTTANLFTTPQCSCSEIYLSALKIWNVKVGIYKFDDSFGLLLISILLHAP